MKKDDEIKKLKKDLRSMKNKYNIELKNNRTLITANTRLVHENKYLKRDLARIPKVLKYIDSCKKEVGYICNFKIIRQMLDGSYKDDTLEV